MKKILSLLLAAVMLMSLFALAACEDDSKPPIGGPGESDNGTGEETEGGGEDSETETQKETEQELEENGLPSQYFSDFIPDPDAQYTGMVGIGANKAGVDFDNFRVISADKKDIIYEEFTEITELNSLIFTGHAALGGNWDADLADWVIGADDLDAENKQLTFTAEDATGAALFMGNSEWGPYRVNVKVKIADETEIAYVYFCVKDENNYYVLEVGAENNTCLRVLKVTDGTSEVVSQIGIGVPVGEWNAASVQIEHDQITVYMTGDELIRIGGEESDEPLITGKFGVGQWNTQFYIDNFQIVDAATGEVYYSEDFENADDLVSKMSFGNRNGGNYTYTEGDWVVKNEVDAEGNTLDNKVLSYEGSNSIYGAIAIFPDIEIPETCKGYKILMDAYRVGGSGTYEFTAIVWGYESDTNYWNYNYGGWSGAGAVQEIVNGTKTNHQTATLIGMQNGVWQKAEVQVYNDVIYSFFDGKLVQLHWID